MLAFNPNEYTNYLSAASCGTLLKNYYYTNTGATTNTNAKVWQYVARIRLKDLHDVFAQLQLMRGLYARFIINCNIATVTLTLTNQAGTTTTPTQSKVTQSALTLSGGSVPFMISSFKYGQSNSYMMPITTGNIATATLKVQNAIASLTYTANSDTVTINHSQRTCRLYAPLITMNIDAERQYLSLNETKRVVYEDIYQYTISNVTATTGTINNLLTNGYHCYSHCDVQKTLQVISVF